jgi:acetyl esterase/lipase
LNALGYVCFSVEYRLAPPGHLGGQTSQGYYPEQTDDVKLAVLKARTDPRCNGKVGAMGGSAGGHHAAFLAADGKDGADKVDVAVCLSGAYDFSDEESLNHQGQFRKKVQNYAHSTDKAVLLARSPVARMTPGVSPMLLVETENDTMPPHQMPVLEAKLKSLGVTNYQAILLPGGGHSFANWPRVKDQCIAFLDSVLKDKPLPPASPR